MVSLLPSSGILWLLIVSLLPSSGILGLLMVSLLPSSGILRNGALYRLQVFWELIIYFKRSYILGASHGFLTSLQVFGIWYSCQSSGILWVNQAFRCFWDYSRFEGYSWFPFQPWGIMRVTLGFLPSVQVLLELLLVFFPVFRYY